MSEKTARKKAPAEDVFSNLNGIFHACSGHILALKLGTSVQYTTGTNEHESIR